MLASTCPSISEYAMSRDDVSIYWNGVWVRDDHRTVESYGIHEGDVLDVELKER